MVVETPLILVGVIILIGFIGHIIFKKTGIPNIIWLLIIGLALGPVGFSIVNAQIFFEVSEIFAAVAIIIILFDSGINMELYTLFRGAPLAMLFTMLTFFFSVGITTLFMVSIGVRLLEAILMGAIIGGTSSPIIIPIVSKLKGLNEKTKTVLSLESAITDVMCIIIAIIIIEALTLGGEANLMSTIQPITAAFSIGIILGLASGILWIPIMHRILKQEFSYLVTLGILFFIYAGVEILQGSGPLAVLVFGIVLGNGKKIFSILKYTNKAFEIDTTTRQFHSLISFFMRTFFFVYMGILVTIGDASYVLIGIALILLILAVRSVAVMITTYNRKEFKAKDKMIMTVMLSRGLAAAVLALLASRVGFADIAFIVILGTAIIPTFGVVIANKMCNNNKIKPEIPKKSPQQLKKPKFLEFGNFRV